jgi:hypothetical protein
MSPDMEEILFLEIGSRASGKGRWRAFGGWINAVIPILIVQ